MMIEPTQEHLLRLEALERGVDQAEHKACRRSSYSNYGSWS